MQIDASQFHSSLHLDESKLEPLNNRCPFCSSTNRQQEYTLQESPEVLLLQCNDCHAISASRMPTDEALAEYYGGYYDAPNAETADGLVTFNNPKRLARNLADQYRRYCDNTTVSILDFGGGDGTISHLLALQLIEHGAMHVSITVVDYNNTIVQPEDSRIAINRVASLDDIKSQYGFVIASAVIEHFPQPRELLQNLLQCMDKGGMFYARTPSMLPIMKLFQRFGMKIDFTYPGHIHDLGQEFWEGYFTNQQSADFQILESRPSIVETTLRHDFLRTVTAYFFKAPWYLFGKSYRLVGGWEIFIRKQ